MALSHMIVHFLAFVTVSVLAVAGQGDNNYPCRVRLWIDKLIKYPGSGNPVAARLLRARSVNPADYPPQCQSICMPIINAINVYPPAFFICCTIGTDEPHHI